MLKELTPTQHLISTSGSDNLKILKLAMLAHNSHVIWNIVEGVI